MHQSNCSKTWAALSRSGCWRIKQRTDLFSGLGSDSQALLQITANDNTNVRARGGDQGSVHTGVSGALSTELAHLLVKEGSGLQAGWGQSGSTGTGKELRQGSEGGMPPRKKRGDREKRGQGQSKGASGGVVPRLGKRVRGTGSGEDRVLVKRRKGTK